MGSWGEEKAECEGREGRGGCGGREGEGRLGFQNHCECFMLLSLERQRDLKTSKFLKTYFRNIVLNLYTQPHTATKQPVRC